MWPQTVHGAVAAALMVVGTLVPQQQSLRDLVRSQGDVDQLILEEWGPADLSALVTTSDLAVAGRIQRASSYLVNRDTSIRTDYEFVIEQLVKQSSEPRQSGDVIRVRRSGGTVTIDGYTVVARVADFPGFDVGERYVLFRRVVTGEKNVFTVNFGAQGTFSVIDGRVRQVEQLPDYAYGESDFETFLAEVSRYVRMQLTGDLTASGEPGICGAMR